MDMLKDKKARSVIAIYAIVFCIYLLLFLTIPFSKGIAAWISFAFTLIAFLFSLYSCWVAYRNCDSAISAVYSYPVFRVGLIYAVLQLICGVVICIIGCLVPVSYWIPLVLFALMLGTAIVGLIVTDNVRDTVLGVETKAQGATRMMMQLQLAMSAIVNFCEVEEVKEELLALNDAFKYSDPISSAATEKLEGEIAVALTALKTLVMSGDADSIVQKAHMIHVLLQNRNELCKAKK